MVSPSAIQVAIKTRRTSVHFTASLASTLQDLKHETLSALSQFSTLEDNLPSITSIDDFELHRKEVQPGPRGVPPTVRYVPLEDDKTVKQLGLSNWEVLYVRYKDESGSPLCFVTDFELVPFIPRSTNMSLLDIDVTEALLEDEEEDSGRGSQSKTAGNENITL
ncbi:uncharacterized protein EI90DRAFT_3039284 [Cantharellus anzutake]|uniref:uncharacterized protein n=1 Tax=Cantharellus anzutake TaxID=1750568 RepID=UPI00190505C2|nr:uncharacterized protein EI90DRAFT_3039284 [Cantharellus anzutake]KAF8338824.1 hypothetical protein EI90DRAFT_3039284 [Cantharellus anzutake]